MVTKRQYLIEKGLAKPGRGRMSNAAREAINKAINKGVKFDEPETGTKTVTVKTKDEKGKTVVTTKRVQDVPTVPDARPDRPNGTYVFENEDGTKFNRGAATACVRCSYSLQWCYCPDGPVIYSYPHSLGGYASLAEIKAVTTSKDVPAKPPTRGTRGGTTRRGTRRRRA